MGEDLCVPGVVAEIRGQLAGVSSCLSVGGVWELNSRQVRWETPLPAQLSGLAPLSHHFLG